VGEEVAEYKAIFLDRLKGLEVATKYKRQFDTNSDIIVLCNKADNELYRLKDQAMQTQDIY
jgi:hypothetical protein